MFVVLFIAAALLLNTPQDNDPDSTWTAYFANHNNQVRVTLAGFIFVVAGLCLLAFLTCLWLRIRDSRTQSISPLPLLTATMSASAIALNGLVGATVTGGMLFGTLKEPGVDVLRVVVDISYPFLLIGGMFPAALSVVVLASQARSAGLFAKWVLVLSWVVAVGLLASVFFIPMILLLIWVLVVTVLLLRAGSAPATSTAPAALSATSG
ncbi:MAG TPA: hypothetical protein VI316_10305 [Candidatus Dormibacteraeota bacterium]